MLTEGRRKQYVEVLATHRIDGSVRPQSITFALGNVYVIDEIKGEPCRVKDNLSHEIAMQYTVVINGKETQLFEDSGRWFVRIKIDKKLE